MIYGSAGPCVTESFVGFLARPMKAGRCALAALLRYLDVAVRGRRRLAPGALRLIVFLNSYSRSRDMTGGDACCIEIMTRLEDFDNSRSDFAYGRGNVPRARAGRNIPDYVARTAV